MAYLPQRDPTNVIGRRIVAFIIDTILLDAIAVAALAATKSASYTNAPSDACSILRAQTSKSISCVQLGSHAYTWDGSRLALAIGVAVLAAVLDLVLLQGMTGASVGKMVLGLRVVDAQGRTCGVGRAIVRWIVGFVDLLCAGLVGLVTVLVTHPHRRIGDMGGGTYVVATADAGTPIVSVGAQAPVYAYSGAGWTPPAPGAPQWGAQPQPQSSGWPPPAAPQAPPWGAPVEQQPAPPSWGAPPPPLSWGTPPPTEQPAAPAPAAPPAPRQGESWWDNSARDDEPEH